MRGQASRGMSPVQVAMAAWLKPGHSRDEPQRFLIGGNVRSGIYAAAAARLDNIFDPAWFIRFHLFDGYAHSAGACRCGGMHDVLQESTVTARRFRHTRR